MGNKEKQEELMQIITKFANSGWDVIDIPSKAWLKAKESDKLSNKISSELIIAIEKANQSCGNCGCEFDPLYKKVLMMKDLLNN